MSKLAYSNGVWDEQHWKKQDLESCWFVVKEVFDECEMGVQDEGTNNMPPTCKTRLVACGCEQHEGIDYEKTFAPIVKSGTIRTLVALATQHE